MLARGPHLPETFAVQVAQRRERAQEEQHKAERSVAGRVRQVLLPEDRSRQGEHKLLSLALSTSPGPISILLSLSLFLFETNYYTLAVSRELCVKYGSDNEGEFKIEVRKRNLYIHLYVKLPFADILCLHFGYYLNILLLLNVSRTLSEV